MMSRLPACISLSAGSVFIPCSLSYLLACSLCHVAAARASMSARAADRLPLQMQLLLLASSAHPLTPCRAVSHADGELALLLAGGSSGVALQEAAGAAVGAASRPCRLALQGSCPAAASIRGLQCLSLLGRGLSMRRQGLDCTPVMLDILDAAPAAEVSGAGGQAAAQGAASAAKGRGSAAAAARQAPDPSVVAAAARSFAQTIGSSSPSRICELSRATHAQVGRAPLTSLCHKPHPPVVHTKLSAGHLC